MGDRGKFDRMLPESRRKALIDATLACLAREGHAGLSIRKISREAGISIGLINHHFASKGDLIAAAYEALSLDLLDLVRAKVDECGCDPRAKLSAYVEGILSAPTLEQTTLRTWVVFWSMIESSTAMINVHDRTYAEYRFLLEALLAEAATQARLPFVHIRLAAIGLTAMLDGLWLEWCLNPSTFSRQEAIELCENWIDALLGGQLTKADFQPAKPER